MDFITIFGYAATVLIAISLMMSSIVKLRLINFFGAASFSIYGLIIGAYPVFILNGFITLIDVYYLIQIFGTKEYFRVLEVKHDSEYLHHFLNFHKKDIEKFIPSFSFNLQENGLILFVLRNTVPAGVVYAEHYDEESLFMKLDFAIPGYRDFKMARYVFPALFKEKNVKKLYSDPGNKKHESYLRKMGFVETVLDSKPVFCLTSEQASK